MIFRSHATPFFGRYNGPFRLIKLFNRGPTALGFIRDYRTSAAFFVSYTYTLSFLVYTLSRHALSAKPSSTSSSDNLLHIVSMLIVRRSQSAIVVEDVMMDVEMEDV